MRKKHDYAPNNKIVAGPHSFSEPHQPSAEPAGGGAQGPQMPMFCNGGKYADGGETKPDILGGGIRGKLADYGAAIKQTASDAVDKLTSKNPVASGSSDASYEGVGGAARKAAQDAVIDQESG